MLQVARLAPQLLGDSRNLVVDFLRGCLNPDGGFQDRAGKSDLYYTVFGLDALIALQEPLPSGQVASYLRLFGTGQDLDLVNLACLARCWSALSRERPHETADAMARHVERYRSADGGYAQTSDVRTGSIYASFLAFGAYQDLGLPMPAPHRVLESITKLQAADGAFSNRRGEACGLTAATAAAVLLLRHFDCPADRHLGLWLLDRCHASGGFLAAPTAPVPDLLSTATALHALAALNVPLAGIHDACLDFVDSLWTNRGGFYGAWSDDVIDCEFTFYALLALGHLGLVSPPS
jgi:prenyltransferase beta subunit